MKLTKKHNTALHLYQSFFDNKRPDLEYPHSDVFYVRAALRERIGKEFTLEEVENAMRKEGWKD